MGREKEGGCGQREKMLRKNEEGMRKKMNIGFFIRKQGGTVPLCRFPAFLAEISETARSCGWAQCHCAILLFARPCFLPPFFLTFLFLGGGMGVPSGMGCMPTCWLPIRLRSSGLPSFFTHFFALSLSSHFLIFFSFFSKVIKLVLPP